MSEFIAPKPDTITLNIVKAILPIYLKAENLSVRPSEHCLSVIKSQKNIPAVLALNHIDRCDPAVSAMLSTMCGEENYYLAARELFDENFGIRGWLMQHCGVYSVIRGMPEDVESRKATVNLIAAGKHKLIMFPEGDVTGRDDVISPLKKDGIRNIFEAQEKSLKIDPQRAVHVIPTAIYYQVHDDAWQPLKDCLGRLEGSLGLTEGNGPMESRIQRVIEKMLQRLEFNYGVVSTKHEANAHSSIRHNSTRSSLSTNARLVNLCRHIISAVANITGAQVLENPSIHVFLYSVRGKLIRMSEVANDLDGTFDDRLRAETIERLDTCTRDLDRVQNLLILASALHQKPRSLDVLWRIIDRLEQLILGRVSAKGSRTAWIEAGEPISLLRRSRDYRVHPISAVERAEKRLRASMQAVLDGLKHPAVADEKAA
jgi:1-acyl-sn-glycerol-3-phosphate acyltransferase